MNYRLTIEPDAAALGLTNAYAVVVFSAQSFESTELPNEVLEAAILAAPKLPPIEDDGYHRVLSALGYPNVEPAGRRLVRVVEKRGLRSYGLLVDACNVVALRHAAGIGLHDIGDRLCESNEIAVLRATGSERIVPAFRDSELSIPSGDLVYGIRGPDSFEPLAWLGKRDTDSATGQIGEMTERALVMVLGHDGLSAHDTATICSDVANLICRYQQNVIVTPVQRMP